MAEVKPRQAVGPEQLALRASALVQTTERDRTMLTWITRHPLGPATRPGRCCGLAPAEPAERKAAVATATSGAKTTSKWYRLRMSIRARCSRCEKPVSGADNSGAILPALPCSVTARSWWRSGLLGSVRRSVPVVCATAVLCLLASGCGSGGPSSAGASSTGGPGARTAKAPEPAARSQPTSSEGFSLSTLAGLRDYTFTYIATGGDVDGQGYSTVRGSSTVQHVSFRTPEGRTHLSGEYTWAQAFIGFTHVSGVRIVAAGSCSVAGARGTTYDFKTPSSDNGIFSIADQACVEKSSGALLSFDEGVTGGSAASATGLSGKAESFTVTSIGGVGPMGTPSGSPAA